jgi:type III restriction enzyme
LGTGNPFFDHPILNSPYTYPSRHWELDAEGQPTQQILTGRRLAKFVTPIPMPRKRKGVGKQTKLALEEEDGLADGNQEYNVTPLLNELREQVDQWRRLPSPYDWGVTPETARLLQHWRHYDFQGARPFFCQVEAVETVIYLTEVARPGRTGKAFLEYLVKANADANPGLSRLALKLATGAGKTTVMAMLIAWQTVNAVRRPNSSLFTRGFLIVTPGLTIKDRLRVLKPNDPESYYKHRELIPAGMLMDMGRAEIVITNYHAFKLRDELELAKGNRALLGGRKGALNTVEPEGKMLQRVIGDLMGIRNILVLNDEAHHCYREKPGGNDETDLAVEERDEAEKNREAARLWIRGLETVGQKLGIQRILDLSATPFFLRGSGYREGTLFPWTMSDFSLMDAIECGIVKLPRVPVSDDIPNAAVPVFRNLWDHIRNKMPRKGRGKGENFNPKDLPTQLCTALDALFGHYKATFDSWREQGKEVEPCFIVVCQNTSASKLVYDYISGYTRPDEHGVEQFYPAKFELFSNYDEHGNPRPRPRSLLIDSEQLESGDALDPGFRAAAALEIDRFRREKIERGDQSESTDQDLLREVMNTVGKPGRLGGSIRCVVSVSMLTEGWDANTVTHVLGVRAFGTQLLCEQVIGRALRRESYNLIEEGEDKGKFPVQYADILGIPFDFTAKPVVAPPQKPLDTIQVRALPEREALEIRFPRVLGYRTELPDQRMEAAFSEDSTFVLTPEMVGATNTRNEGIIGEGINLTVKHLKDTRPSEVLSKLTARMLNTTWRESGEPFNANLFGPLKSIVRQWLNQHLVCLGGTYPAQILYPALAERACDRIMAAITLKTSEHAPIKALLDSYNPVGSTRHVNFITSKTDRWKTDSRRCHVNWVILDSGWEAEFCRVAEQHPRVRAYAKNHSLGFEVPYRCSGDNRIYRPDFLLLVDDGRGQNDLLHLIVEIKGYRGEDAKDKKLTMETYWIPGVNNSGTYGRWAFAEFREVFAIESDFAAKVHEQFESIMRNAASVPASAGASA